MEEVRGGCGFSTVEIAFEKMDFLSVERDFYEVFVCGVVGVCGLWWFA